MAAAGGDLVGSGQLQDSDGEVSQGGHDPQSVAGADLGGVLAVGDVADVVQGFDALVAADPLGCSPVLADQALDGLSALDPGGKIDGVAGLVQRRSLFPRLVGPVIVVMRGDHGAVGPVRLHDLPARLGQGSLRSDGGLIHPKPIHPEGSHASGHAGHREIC